jgi:anti-anti-sigma factor
VSENVREAAVEIGERRQANILVLRPVGRIDEFTSAEFQSRLLAAATSTADDIVVDFSSVEYISSAGLRALMAASRLKAKERRLAVACLNSVVSEIFSISRFSHVVPVFTTVQEASVARHVPSRPEAAIPQPETQPVGPLRIRFWGTRGSLPAPVGARAVRVKIRDALLAARGQTLETEAAIDAFIDNSLPFSVRGTFGGNTSCVEIVTGGDEYVICDLGTGVRELGTHVMAEHDPAAKRCFNVFLSHLHWDHIMGFPFFRPAYIPGNLIRIHSSHAVVSEALHKQQSAPCFPIDFRALPATIEFVALDPGQTYQIGGLSVTTIKQFHAGDSYGYRFNRGDKTIIYSTDCEHKYSNLDQSYPFIAFYRNADVLIFDAMYSLADAISVKEDWGHSNNIVAVELAQAAGVKRLVLFHHEPAYDDGMIEEVFAETVRFEEISRPGHTVELISAYDGLELEL